jgi:hypothetical protein
MTTQYKDHVTSAQRELIAALAELGSEMTDNLSQDKYDAPQIAPIEGNYKSGWIPSQDGGLHVSCLADCGWGSGNYLCSKHRGQVESQADFAYKQMASGLPDVAEDSEESFEYVSEYMSEPILIYFEAFIEYDGSVTMRHGWNYRDAPYYREKYADDLHCVTFTPSELEGRDAASIFAEYMGGAV